MHQMDIVTDHLDFCASPAPSTSPYMLRVYPAISHSRDEHAHITASWVAYRLSVLSLGVTRPASWVVSRLDNAWEVEAGTSIQNNAFS
jgi:hypothetical protein